MKLSFSTLNIKNKCERQFYYKKIVRAKKTDKTDDKYARFGTVVHDAIENIHRFKTPEQAVNHYWIEQELTDEMDITLAYKSIIYSLSIPGEIKHKEQEINFKFHGYDFIAKIDIVLENGVIRDWKTSTYDIKKVKEYKEQILFYSWVYYHVFNIIPPKGQIVFCKPQKKNKQKDGVKFIEEYYVEPIEIKINEEILKEFEFELVAELGWLKEQGSDFKEYQAIPEQKKCHWCPYKKRCRADNISNDLETVNIRLTIEHDKIFIRSEVMDPVLEKVLNERFSYEIDNKYFAIKAMRKKGNYSFDGIIRLYRKGDTDIAFKKEVIKILQGEYTDYLRSKGKRLNLIIIDHRIFPNVSADLEHLDSLKGIELRDYQKESVSRMQHEKINMGEICTGAGKTLMAAELIRRLNKKCLFVVDVKLLMDQTKKVFEKVLGCEIGTITEGKQDWKKVNVATIQTVRKFLTKIKLVKNDYINHKIENQQEFLKNLSEVNLVIIDEAHASKSKSYKLFMNNIKAEYRIGLTGTAYADGNSSLELYRSFGFVEHKITTRELIDKGFLVEPTINFVKYKKPQIIHGNQNDIYEQICNSDERLNKCLKIIPCMSKTLIICRRLEQVHKIGRLLYEHNLLCGIIEGTIPKKDREHTIQMLQDGKIDVIIGTERIVQKGLDIPSLDTLINYTGNIGSILSVQSLGRILRLFAGKHTATYYDFYDESLKKDFKTRIKHFEKLGYKVNIIEDVKDEN